MLFAIKRKIKYFQKILIGSNMVFVFYQKKKRKRQMHKVLELIRITKGWMFIYYFLSYLYYILIFWGGLIWTVVNI